MDGRLVNGKAPTLRNAQKLLLKDNYPGAGPVDCRTLCRKYPTRAICTVPGDQSSNQVQMLIQAGSCPPASLN